MRGIVNQLIKAGLTPLQARVYTTLLSVGESTASELGEKAGVKRVTTYATLEDLIQMKLVDASDLSGIRIFRPASLTNLEAEFLRRAKASAESFRIVQEIMPDLHDATHLSVVEPKAELHEGLGAVQRYFEKSSGLLHSLYISRQEHYELIRTLVKLALEAEIRPRAIIPNSVKPELLVYLDHRVVPAKSVQFPATTINFNDAVAILVQDGRLPQLFVISDARVAVQHREMFDLEWRILSGEHIVVANNE